MKKAATKEYMAENNVHVLVADRTTDNPAADALMDKLGNKAKVMPFYALYPANGSEPIVFSDVPLTQGNLIKYLASAVESNDNDMIGSNTSQNVSLPAMH